MTLYDIYHWHTSDDVSDTYLLLGPFVFYLWTRDAGAAIKSTSSPDPCAMWEPLTEPTVAKPPTRSQTQTQTQAQAQKS